MLRSHLQWFAEQKMGDVDAVRKRVSPETATVLGQPLFTGRWYPFRVLIEIDRAIAGLSKFAEERAAIVEMGRASARINLTTNYRVYNKAQPHQFFESAAQLHSHFLDFGRAEYRRIGDRECQLSMYDYPCFSEVFCWSALGYYQQATELQGGQHPEVKETLCLCSGGAACRFEIRWE